MEYYTKENKEVGEFMKKWAWLLVLVIIISCTSEAIAYSKRLSHPIVLEVTIDHDFQNLYVSYLTNRQKPTIMQSVIVGDRTLYPQNSGFSFMAEPAQPNSFKDYTYYSIYSELISLNMELEDPYFTEMIDSFDKATVTFNNGHYAEEVPLKVIRHGRLPAFLLSGNELVNGKLELQILVEDEFELQGLTLEENYGQITGVSLQGEPVTLPFQLKEDDVVVATVEEAYALYMFDQVYVTITGLQNGQQFKEVRGAMTNSQPTEEWVLEKVGQLYD